jgi:hypothetical protein
VAANGCEVATSSSLSNCGACGTVCGAVANGAAACNNGSCGVGSCNPGFGNCDGNAANGCEKNLNNDTANCGACGKPCTYANGVGACLGGQCGLLSCSTGFADCNTSAVDGCEVNINTSSANCGACNKACPANQSCNAGACGGCDPSTDVSYLEHCYYLDGSGGTCDVGYALVSQSILTNIAASFVGKTYKHTVSANCCIQNADAVENWGFPFPGPCNAVGPFAQAPALGGASCVAATNHDLKQLTLCGK